jgi:hypothetical protein
MYNLWKYLWIKYNYFFLLGQWNIFFVINDEIIIYQFKSYIINCTNNVAVHSWTLWWMDFWLFWFIKSGPIFMCYPEMTFKRGDIQWYPNCAVLSLLSCIINKGSGWSTQSHCQYRPSPLQQGFSDFVRPGATVTLPYRLAGRKVINEDNLLKLDDSSLKMLPNYAYYYKQVYILPNNLLLHLWDI